MFTSWNIERINEALKRDAEAHLSEFDHSISGKALSVGKVRVFVDTSSSDKDGNQRFAIRAAIETENDNP